MNAPVATIDPQGTPTGFLTARPFAGTAFSIHGDWVLANAQAIEAQIEAQIEAEIDRQAGPHAATAPAAGDTSAASLLAVDATALQRLDTVGASLLLKAAWRSGGSADALVIHGLDADQQRLFDLVRERSFPPEAHITEPYHHGLVWNLGKATARLEPLIESQIRYFGYVATLLWTALSSPRQLRWREMLIQCQRSGLDAIPVVVLITFLIGIVMAYLIGLQAAQYGASVFVIDGVALGMVREFSPLLVAIIIAGRSGAAFTAELGTMRLSQETDAIAMLGLSPGQVLIVPRVLALMITMPLLVFIGDLSGLVGAAMVCRWMLDLSFQTFTERIHSFLALEHVIIGLGKAPCFALAIATIACRHGMTASRDTRAIGIATTSTVVQAIVTVIVIDAAFAVTFQIGDL